MCFHLHACLYSHAGKPELSSEVDIIVADVAEPDSLTSLCKQAVIILNCVGPVSITPHHNMCPCTPCLMHIQTEEPSVMQRELVTNSVQ